GAASFVVLLLPAMARRGASPTPETLRRAPRRTAAVGMVAAAVLGAAAGLRLVAQAAVLRGVGGAGGDLLTALLTRTAWGWGWVLQAFGVLLAAGGFWLARRDRRGGWSVASGAAILLAVTPALSGHAATVSGLAIATD